MTEAEVRALTLALFHCRGGHAPALARAAKASGSVAALSALPADTLRRQGLSEAQIALLQAARSGAGRAVAACTDARSADLIARDLEWAHQDGQHLLSYDSSDYPLRLRETACPPLLLYVRGSLATLNALQLAIVGSRNASDYGRRNAYWMARELCAAGLAICSGLALGVDASAHEGALDARAMGTIAVLGTGIDRVYPSRHRDLCERIAAEGAVVSEFPLGTRAYAYNFPRRNRLISGLSAGVLVVEATLKSGSLITARCALEQNRDVYALPSLLSNPQGRGCHSLIKQGALLVDEPADILQEFGLESAPGSRAGRCEDGCEDGRACQAVADGLPADLQPLQRHLLQRLRTEDCLFDSLLDADLASFAVLNHALLDLEIRGLVSCRGGRYSLA